MSFPVAITPVSSSPSLPHGKQRNTVNFHRSIWGYQFLTYTKRKDLAHEEQLAKELEEEVQKKLVIPGVTEPAQYVQLMTLIDAVQRLGVAHHFETEIEECLQHIYITYGDQWSDGGNLQSTSIWFRLLRQQGFNISSGIFNKYKNEGGNFMESVKDDVQGMLSLYEAAYMRVKGEDLLDEILEYTTYHLRDIAKNHDDASLKAQIHEALQQPLRKRLPRLEALRYIPIYQQQPFHNEALLMLAKLDFNLLQDLHRKELSEITKWWKDLDVCGKLPYVRDRIVEGYFWILAVYYETRYSDSRIFLMKICNLIVILDDTYDNYGTYEELEIFTEAIQRWSTTCLDMLPEYMKFIYQVLLDVYKEAEELLEKKGQGYRINYTKKMMKRYVRNLLMEAKWVKDAYIPAVEEHMNVTIVTVACALIFATCYVHEDDLITVDTFKWVSSYPPLVKASCLIARLMNDIATSKKEQERNHVASSVECYMKQYNVSVEQTHELFSQQIEDEWKVINEECLGPTMVPRHVLMPPINFARAGDVLYTGGDNFGHAGKEMVGYIKSLLVNPLSL